MIEIAQPGRHARPGRRSSRSRSRGSTPPSWRRDEYLGAVLKLCQDRRGVQIELDLRRRARVMVSYELPLNEVVFDFYDRLKSRLARLRLASTISSPATRTADLVQDVDPGQRRAGRCAVHDRAPRRAPRAAAAPWCEKLQGADPAADVRGRRSRRRSAARSSRARPSRRCART